MTTRPSTFRRTLGSRLGLGRPASAPGHDWVVAMPRIVLTLLALMVLVFVIGWVLPRQAAWRLDYALGFVPARFAAVIGGDYGVVRGAGPLLSHVFVHGNLTHIVVNAMGLAIFGTAVARRLRVEGGGARNAGLFLGFFFASGVAGALCYGLVNAGSGILLVGASGAISGLMAGAMRFALRALAPYGPQEGPLAPLTAYPVVTASAVYVGFNLLTPLGLGRLIGAGLPIAWEAHVGGYLFGLLAFPLFDRAVRRPA